MTDWVLVGFGLPFVVAAIVGLVLAVRWGVVGRSVLIRQVAPVVSEPPGGLMAVTLTPLRLGAAVAIVLALVAIGTALGFLWGHSTPANAPEDAATPSTWGPAASPAP